MSRTIHGTLSELSDLTDAARILQRRAEERQMVATAAQVRGIALNLDAARTRLIENPDYLTTAQAFVAAASEYLPAHAAHVGRWRADASA